MYSWAYGLRKMWLDKCLKSPVSEDPSTSNMVNGAKHCWNLNESTFTVFIHPCAGKSGWKCLSEQYQKSYDCLLTHCLPLRSILFLIEAIYPKIFRCNYLRNENFFLSFRFHFQNLDYILNISKKKDDPHSRYIFQLMDSEKRG